MNKTLLVHKVAEQNRMQKTEAEKIIASLFHIISDTLASGEAVHIVGFGKLETKPTKAKLARNLHTGQPLQLPPSKKISFKPAKMLKDRIKHSE
ncbi:HU family DNA-binding protein [Paenibacillus sp. J5C_2022]|uniref:HU family DNA-binding protein n=1 Tax=Paenibacillus sp. J5C2022 TaxID=2977129 RepID=UPI0021D1C289|nr:HU family DNA-binding protein [Paenibacillus sp. J5C2022]MCU6710068.1 HU family DNA-binding protein [Paenibacillus sp. J5C2022]